MSAPIAKVGDTIPDATLMEIPWTSETEAVNACGIPSAIKTHSAFAGKKVVVIGVPGAFTPTCTANHIPAYVAQANEFRQKGYEVYVLAVNDVFVMSAFGKASGAKDDIHFVSDSSLEFSKGLGAVVDMSSKGFGVRTGRYALIADDLKISHFALEENPGAVSVSGYDAVSGFL